MEKESKQKAKRIRKVGLLDRTLWHNYLVVVGIIGTFVTLVSFFGTADDIKVCKPLLGMIFAWSICKEAYCCWQTERT